jgi:ribosomal protein S18 acetylase RimI-like enzyme
MDIRQFRYTDLDALIHIAEVSFAEEQAARGETPESFARQIRMVTRGRMIPFKVLAALAGYRWELFVAEVDGKVVGCGGYVGRQHMELSNLMVHPQYRRRGIGQALLKKRLQRLTEKGYPFVTTTILASNQASLGNVYKQGFEVFDRYSILESPLPLQEDVGGAADNIISRLIQPSDAAAFKQLEAQVANPATLQIQGSAAPNYFPSFGERIMSRFTNIQRWTRAFARNGAMIGFLTASTSSNQTKGTIARPMVAEQSLDALPVMLHEASNWLTQLGKTAVQMAVPDERASVIEGLQNSGWVKTQSWMRLVKRLDEQAT